MTNENKGFLSRFAQGLKKTHDHWNEKVVRATSSRLKLDDAMLDELEEALISSDIGMGSTDRLIGSLRSAIKKKTLLKPEEIRPFLRKEIEAMVDVSVPEPQTSSPHVILVIGVNGSGKTTSIGKLAHLLTGQGKSVLIAAADTFRAAAIEQLTEWSKRVGCEIVRHREGSDPSAVVFDAAKASIARKKDVMIVDTAGRLHTRVNLMEELKKIKRIVSRELESAPHETLLVLDGTTGQNAIAQVKEFNNNIPLTGIILTKLDGTSKGGAIIGILNETKIPIKFIGLGEKIDDLQAFDPKAFAEALI